MAEKPNIPVRAGVPGPKEMPNRPNQKVMGSIPEKEKISHRLFKSFFKAKPGELAEGLLFNTIVPGALKVISDTGKNAIDGMLYGTSPKPSSGVGAPGTNYNAMSAPKINRLATNNSVANKIWPNNIQYQSHEDASHVLELLVDHIANYRQVSISAVYDFSNMQQYDQYTYQNYGWYNLSQARVIPSTYEAGKWMIDFPNPQLLAK